MLCGLTIAKESAEPFAESLQFLPCNHLTGHDSLEDDRDASNSPVVLAVQKFENLNEKMASILGELRQCLEALYGDHLIKMVLYGSQARGDARPDSDIDVLIVLKEPFDYSHETEQISFIIAPVCLEHNVVIGCAFVTLEQFQQGNSAFFGNVRREGIAV